jgi:hypothetical protein
MSVSLGAQSRCRRDGTVADYNSHPLIWVGPVAEINAIELLPGEAGTAHLVRPELEQS